MFDLRAIGLHAATSDSPGCAQKFRLELALRNEAWVGAGPGLDKLRHFVIVIDDGWIKHSPILR